MTAPLDPKQIVAEAIASGALIPPVPAVRPRCLTCEKPPHYPSKYCCECLRPIYAAERARKQLKLRLKRRMPKFIISPS